MKLEKVHITNFRSIEDATLELGQGLRILVGVNESGKSNILRAISALDPEFETTKSDVREPREDEDPNIKGSIEFKFLLDDDDRESIAHNFEKKICTGDDHNIFNVESQPKPAKTLLLKNTKALYEFDVNESSGTAKYYKFREVKLGRKIFSVAKTCPDGYAFDLNGEKVNLKKYKFLVGDNLAGTIPGQYLTEATLEQVIQELGLSITAHVSENLPSCIFWRYSDAHLLPGRINIDKFKSDPDSCLPLKYMFNMAGYEEIKSAIDIARERNVVGFTNLLNKVSEKATKTLRSVWKDDKGISISLKPDGDSIIASIADHYNQYEFSARSDGFKRFVSFLIFISCRVRSNKLEDALIIIDEPENSLHPSGAKYLRDELRVIAKKNYVIYSTHSIYMIDRDEISNNLIVKKRKEKTSLEPCGEANVVDEEVIYNALGTSVFESIKKKNIILEGWKDKQLFLKATEHRPALKKKFASMGICHVPGVKSLEKFTPVFELSGAEAAIFTDDDETARNRKKAHKENKAWGDWYTYSDVDDGCECVTAEDFLEWDAFKQPMNNLISLHPSLREFDTAQAQEVDKISQIKKWLSGSGTASEDQKNMVRELKEIVFDQIKGSQIRECYFDVLGKLATKLEI